MDTPTKDLAAAQVRGNDIGPVGANASSAVPTPEPHGQSARSSPATGSERLWQALQLKADMFDYLCWLDGMHSPEQLHGVDRLCMASDGTTCWGKSYADSVRVAMEHDKEIFDAMEAASPNSKVRDAR